MDVVPVLTMLTPAESGIEYFVLSPILYCVTHNEPIFIVAEGHDFEQVLFDSVYPLLHAVHLSAVVEYVLQLATLVTALHDPLDR